MAGLSVDERASRGITLAWQEPARFEGLLVDKFVAARARYEALRASMDDHPAESVAPERLRAAVQSLVAFVVHYGRDPTAVETMYMLGDLRSQAAVGLELAGSNFYLKEAIRRRPGSRLAQRAYVVLEANVTMAYTGSGGHAIPQSLRRVLRRFRALAHRS